MLYSILQKARDVTASGWQLDAPATPSPPSMRCRTLRREAGVSSASSPAPALRLPSSTTLRGGSLALCVRKWGELSPGPGVAAAQHSSQHTQHLS
jgi:hypothetical protein